MSPQLPLASPDLDALRALLKTRALALPAVAERWASLGAETSQATPEQFDRTIREEIATFTRSARAANIQPE